jgi:hypothetical protein
LVHNADVIQAEALPSSRQHQADAAGDSERAEQIDPTIDASIEGEPHGAIRSRRFDTEPGSFDAIELGSPANGYINTPPRAADIDAKGGQPKRRARTARAGDVRVSMGPQRCVGLHP